MFKDISYYLESKRTSSNFLYGALIRTKDILYRLIYYWPKGKSKYENISFKSDEYKFIYIINFKVASTSICNYLAEICKPKLKKDLNSIQEQIINIRGFKYNSFREYFKFGFVRNPWARVVSCYRHKVLGGAWNGVYPWSEKIPSFEDFVNFVSLTPDELINIHLKSQYLNFYDSRSRRIADFIGRIENFDRDFAIIQKRIGFKIVTLQKENVNRNKVDYRSFYNARTRRIIEKRYARDIKLFKYTF